MEVAELAPEVGEEPVMDLAELAPEVEEEPVMDLAELAPEVEEEPLMDLAELAPEVEEEPVMDLAELAPAQYVEPPEEVRLTSEAPVDDTVTMLDLVARSGDEEGEEDAPQGSEVEARSSSVDSTVDERDRDEGGAIGDRSQPPAPGGRAKDAGEEEAADDHTPGEPVYTRTLAELYVEQGILDEAIEVYRHLAELNPDDADIPSRIAELESGAGLHQAGKAGSVRAEEEVEALARELHEHGEEAQSGVDSPFGLEEGVDETTAEVEATEGGPTIGEYFEGLLGWKTEGRS